MKHPTNWQRQTVALLVGCLVFSAANTIWAGERPHMDLDEKLWCTRGEHGESLRAQGVNTENWCLYAHAHLLDRHGDPTDEPAAATSCSCGESIHIPWERLELEGESYQMVPALLSAQPGYTRDEHGREFQISFHLRRRGFVGVSNAMTVDFDGQTPPVGHSPSVEVGGISDHHLEDEDRRMRNRFLEARYRRDPVEFEGLLMRVEEVDIRPDDGLWLTFGERRIDIPVAPGYGLTFGRFQYNRFDDTALALLDIGAIHGNFDLYQNRRAENYVMVRIGGGMGVRFANIDEERPLYAHPELGLETAWTLGERGTTAIRADLRLQPSLELVPGNFWMVGEANAAFEQILFAIRDNPVTLFIQPEVRHRRVDFAGLDEVDYRLFAGVRFNMFVPPYVD